MIRASLTIESSSEGRVLLKNPPLVDGGKIVISAIFSKDSISNLLEEDYSFRKIDYKFSILNSRPFTLANYDFIVEIIDNNGNVVDSGKIKDSNGKKDVGISGHARAVKGNFRTVSRNLNGSKILIFKKVRSGDPCPSCWDFDLEASNNSSCPECGGNGWIDYYSYPIKEYAGAIQFQGTVEDVMNEGRVPNVSNTTISMPADVVLEADDLFFHQMSGEWYVVLLSINVASIRMFRTLQTLQISSVPSDSPEIRSAMKNIDEDQLSNKAR